VGWTNQKAEKFMQDDNFKWDNVTIQKMKQYFGLLFLMGVFRKPEIRMYWNAHDILSTPYFFNRQIMSRDRFLKPCKCVSFKPSVCNGGHASRLSEFLTMIRRICNLFMNLANTYALMNHYSYLRVGYLLNNIYLVSVHVSE
jgi:hypothetical protein